MLQNPLSRSVEGEIAQVVAQWDDVGLAGVAIPVGPGRDRLPLACLAEAEKRRLPLLALPNNAAVIELAREVDRAVLADQQARLNRMQRIGTAFTDLTVCGCGTRPMDILDRLAALVNRPLVLFDEFGRAVETRRPAELDDHVFREHDHACAAMAEPGKAEASTADPDRHCLWLPLSLRGVPHGSLHLLATDRPFDEVDMMALDRAVAALATTLLLRQRDQRLSLQAQRNLVADLVSGRRANEREFARRARELGANLAGRQLAAVVVVPMTSAEGVTEPPEWPAIVDCLTAAAGNHGGTALCGGTAETTVALFGVGDRERLALVAEDALNRLHRQHGLGAAVATCLADFPVLPHAFDAATRLAHYGAQRAPGVYPVEQFRLELLFERLNSSAELYHFVRDEIGPLLEHDTRGGQPLLPTLRAYIANRCSKTVTAQRLRIVRRTLYRRLVEIEKILGRDLDDGHAVMRISLALWAWDLISAR
ncbi:transcriptional regulator [Gandjariella thermophila]|uniref:Transcriptional regulator n=1 Tax=Gandjariella thermophila TaxID=1931992 RepID=A0A4D4IZE2_9PSEU|nr:transcriptional regulator [Gandjariella thermophila]